MKYCANCHAALQDDMKFCMNCGAKCEDPKPRGGTCRTCGAQLSEGTAFCMNCGTPVAAPQPVQPVYQRPAAYTAPAPKKKNLGGIIAAVLALVLVLGGAVGFLFGLFGNEPVIELGAKPSNRQEKDDRDETEEDGEDEEDGRETPADGTYRVGIAVYSMNDNFMIQYIRELQAYFASLETDDVKYELTIADAQNDINQQWNQVETFVTQEMDAIILNPVTPSEMGDLVDIVAQAGIPVVVINRRPDDSCIVNNSNVCYVGTDPCDAGTAQGEIITNLPDRGDINGDGVVKYVMIVGDPENPEAQARTEYAIKALTDAGIAVQCLVQENGYWDQMSGHEITLYALAEYSDIDVIFCNNDGMALGAAAAINTAGLTVGEDIYLVGIDALSECQEMVMAGSMTGTVLNDFVSQAHAAGDAAIRLMMGKGVENFYFIPYIKVDSEYFG